MAKAQQKEPVQEESGIAAADLKDLVQNITAEKEKGTEHNGRAGKISSQAIKDHNLDRKAFTLILGLVKKDVAQQQETLRSLLEYAHKMDMFAGCDAFDDVVGRMEAIAAEIRERNGSDRKADNVTKIGQ